MDAKSITALTSTLARRNFSVMSGSPRTATQAPPGSVMIAPLAEGDALVVQSRLVLAGLEALLDRPPGRSYHGLGP